MLVCSNDKEKRGLLRYFVIYNYSYNSKTLAISVVLLSALIGCFYWQLQKYHNNNHGALTSLGLAQQYVNNNTFVDAEQQLKKAIEQTSENNLQSLIKLRLARVQLQQKNIDGALNTLKEIKDQGWTALADDIHGDAQILKGDYKAAQTAYEKALQSNMLSTLVRIKLKNLLS
ncbi:YfgM family protein [Candidatus Hoaglandella endobia]|uniref:Ancillary SecYEG translocon subunit n=1 Tax=Candidatus Hoaglandella endobia TaxID=1778263 RepID=A0A143WX30_9ENTR|nr:tetratricopeptide repeat protein [Candidatus Hoaglandella endobia]CUX97464.1 Tetratricopeptide repeat protein [Candidatus Hoaglandella endobia]